MDTSTISLTIDSVDFGEHLCSIYKDNEQQFSQIIPFLMDGLKSNHKCVYVIYENSKEDIILQFKNLGFDIDKYIKSKQFELLSIHDTYLKEGIFDPDRLIELITLLESNAIKDGYAGLRGTGEMSWIAADLENHKKLIEYEVKLNKFIDKRNIILLCQYVEDKFSHEVLNNIIRTHKKLIIYGKLYKNKYFYIEPMYFDEAKTLPANSYATIIDTIIEE
jgi:KaiC/GvpD/RAD55 family RecA-like ATPase